MPKLVSRGKVILSSILHSTEHLHHPFIVGRSQEGGTVMPILFLSQLVLQLQSK